MREQDAQESEYAFPYHYVSGFRGGFRQSFTDGWSIHYVSTIEFLLERLAGLPWRSLCDIGCGDGRMSREIKINFPDRQVDGIDFSTRAIQLAKAMNQDLPEISFESRDITEGHRERKYDAAVLMEVLEHIPPESAARFVTGVHEQLIPGGFLLLTVPHANKPLEYKHFRHFDSTGLRTILEPHFDVLEIQPFERRSLLTRLLKLFSGNGLYVLNNATLLDLVYMFYKKHLFHCRSESQCQRLFVLAKAR